MRLYALTELHDPEAIELFITDRSVCFAEAATHGAGRAPGQTEAA